MSPITKWHITIIDIKYETNGKFPPIFTGRKKVIQVRDLSHLS